MKKFICLAIIIASLTSCQSREQRMRLESIYNYPNSVVMDKSIKNGVNILEIRTKYQGAYAIFSIRVPKGEYTQFAIGDTIK